MRWLRKNLIPIIGILVLVYLFVPIAVVAILSFNKPDGKFNVSWNQFSLEAWQNICGVPGVCGSFVTSIQIGLIATLVGTILGTMIAFALVRYRFRGRSTTNLLIFLPMATPEVVLGSSLLALFLNLAFPLGFWTVTIAHIMFIISFVVVTVKARLQGMDPRLEEAARDLYADPRATFRYVTFPIYIWGAAQRGIPVQVNALATLVFVIALVTVVSAQVISSRRRRKMESAAAG